MSVALLETSPSAAGSLTRLRAGVAGALLWGAVLLLVLYPLAMVIAAALVPAYLDSQPFLLADFTNPRLLTAAINTLRLGVTVSAFSVVIGVACALLAMQSARDRWIDLIMSVPFLTPPFLASLAWSLAAGARGYLGRFDLFGESLERLIFSFWGLALLMAVHYAPIVYFAVRAQMEKIPASLLWAGQIAGARPAHILARILIPLTIPAVLAGGFLAFANGIEEYGTPLVIGNRIGFPVISTEIGRIVSVYPINLTLASALASVLFAFVGGVYFVSYLIQRDARTAAKPAVHSMPALLPAWGRAVLWAFVALYFLFTIAIPYGSMLLTSLLKLVSAGPTLANLTLDHYLSALAEEQSGLRDALVASFSLALAAAALGTLLGSACARKSGCLMTLSLIPLATPAITMAVGFIRGWNAPWTDWLPLYGSAIIIALFYTAQFLPYAAQYARAGLAGMSPSYEWAARVHGASRAMTATRIVAPLLWPHCLAGAILIFSIAFRELVGSVLLRPPGMQTVSTFILREFDQGSPAAGMAMGVVAIAVALVSVTLARRLVPKKA
jgi:iron(III) transport system permease protein